MSPTTAKGGTRAREAQSRERPVQVRFIKAQRDCQDIADKLNRRPRKRLGFSTPEEVYAA